MPDLAAEAATKKVASGMKLEDEDVEEEEEKPKKPYGAVKKPVKKVVEYVDETLDDPVAEKARRQKLVEQADLEAAKELFGTDGEELDLGTYNPKSEKEFVKFGTLVATKYLTPVKDSAFYKAGRRRAPLVSSSRRPSTRQIPVHPASLASLHSAPFLCGFLGAPFLASRTPLFRREDGERCEREVDCTG